MLGYITSSLLLAAGAAVLWVVNTVTASPLLTGLAAGCTAGAAILFFLAVIWAAVKKGAKSKPSGRKLFAVCDILLMGVVIAAACTIRNGISSDELHTGISLIGIALLGSLPVLAFLLILDFLSYANEAADKKRKRREQETRR